MAADFRKAERGPEIMSNRPTRITGLSNATCRNSAKNVNDLRTEAQNDKWETSMVAYLPARPRGDSCELIRSKSGFTNIILSYFVVVHGIAVLYSPAP
jgi:hypothetical protein